MPRFGNLSCVRSLPKNEARFLGTLKLSDGNLVKTRSPRSEVAFSTTQTNAAAAEESPPLGDPLNTPSSASPPWLADNRVQVLSVSSTNTAHSASARQASQQAWADGAEILLTVMSSTILYLNACWKLQPVGTGVLEQLKAATCARVAELLTPEKETDNSCPPC